MQPIMESISNQATRDHMTLNAAKCAIMQVSFGKTPPPALHILANDQEIATVTTMTLLGVTFTSNLRWDTHIQNLISRANSKRYLLTVLRRAGTTTAQLLRFYLTFIRPGVEYAAPVWHSSISQTQSNSLERVQSSSLRVMWPDLSYRRALEVSGLPTLHSRRENLCRKFAHSLHGNEHFRGWFPPQRHEVMAAPFGTVVT